ncbi:MAG: dihydroorotate dehydrogenase (quinone) [Epsilonproteobacteria bacterium]|nr:MAG: dihydroorotate dehydrogenase (quinone) [Campylobacterota bacterium]
MIKYKYIKNLLFFFEPETAHNIAEFFLENFSKIKPIKDLFIKKYFIDKKIINQTILNTTFKNPIGLAAGFDKNATMIDATYMLGFGYTEVGTVTIKAQKGNEKPRLFRFEKEKSLQNAMGFNNQGADKLLENIKKIKTNIPIGISIGKNKTTKESDAVDEYIYLIDKFTNECDYIAINISSPNTPNLRDLQNKSFVKELFNRAIAIATKPILLKVSADINKTNAIELCKTAIKYGCSGIIATNTTIDYNLLDEAKDFGGISGEVIKEKSFELFDTIAQEFFGKTMLISVGGITDANDVYKRIKAGANLVQIYTSLIYEGPQICKNINTELVKLLKKDGFDCISEAVGANR